MFNKIPTGFVYKIKTVTISRRIVFITLVGLIATPIFAYAIWCVIPRDIEFSYADTTCSRGLVFLPDERKVTSDGSFAIRYSDIFIGKLFANNTCFVPLRAPKEGIAKLSDAPLDGPLFRTSYVVHTKATPRVLASVASSPSPISKPLLFPVDKTDKTFTYTIGYGQNKQVCRANTSTLSCSIDKLGLAQGSEYSLTLSRSFQGSNETKILEQKIATLSPVVIKDSSVKTGQTLYEKPKTFALTVDKPVRNAKGTLELIDGATTQILDTTTTVQSTTITISTKIDLQREKNYRLSLVQAEAVDSSTLSEPYVISFTTSGGPKVSGANIGGTGVDPNARIIITFDQSLDPSVDIAKFATITGVNATTARQNNQIIFTLQNAKRCTPFSLKVIKGITSATNGLPSKEDWALNSRVNCRATAVIGSSVNGRSITAYYYGSGNTTILFTGGMHGSEPSGMSTMQAWAEYLDTHAPEIPADKQVVIVPNTNPDGIAAGNRYNANGVNIDRNFPTHNWAQDIQTTSGVKVGGGGSKPLSEPETRALYNLTTSLNPRAQISFHAQGRLVGANDYADSRTIGNIYASTVSYSTMFDNAEDVMGYVFTGEYDTWVGEKLGRPSLVIELPSARGNYLDSQLTALWKMVRL